jgi:alpha-glucosidase
MPPDRPRPSDAADATTELPWWMTGVVYQVYPRSFADGNGDGVGDLPGLRARLGHLQRLGVDAVWSSPFFTSPMADFGYDVADHSDVDPVFGTLADADALVADAHERGIRVVLDFVPNHTSDRHRWFEASRSSREDPHRGWYVWRDPAPDGGPPNNWVAAFSPEPAWTFDEATGQYYLHLFLPEQPDLDWNHPDAAEAMLGVLRFWLDRGVDGFRADVVHCVGKSPDLPDAPEDLAGLPACIFDYRPGTHVHLRSMRQLLDSYPDDRVLIGETAIYDRERMVSYYGDGDQLSLAFNFLALHAPWRADAWRAEIAAASELHDRVGAWPTWVLSNHDIPRQRTRYGTDARARAAAVLLLTLRGTPFLYAGEELGLEDAEIPPERVVDPGGRDGCRAPFPWTAALDHGWGPQPWLPFPPDAAERSVEATDGDPASMLEHYRRLLTLRRSVPALHRGDMELLDAPEGVLRWRRWMRGAPKGAPAEVEVWINFTDQEVAEAVPDGRWIGGTALPGSEPDAGTPLGPDEARIVVP